MKWIIVVCALVIAASILNIRCTIAVNDSGQAAAFLVCGGRLPGMAP